MVYVFMLLGCVYPDIYVLISQQLDTIGPIGGHRTDASKIQEGLIRGARKKTFRVIGPGLVSMPSTDYAKACFSSLSVTWLVYLRARQSTLNHVSSGQNCIFIYIYTQPSSSFMRILYDALSPIRSSENGSYVGQLSFSGFRRVPSISSIGLRFPE